MRTDGLIGVLYIITEWIMRLAVTNLLWVLFNVPIIFIGLNLLVADTTDEFIFLCIVIMALLPFFFFPATMSMFAIVRDWIINQVDVQIIRSFWKHYKMNYVRSMFGGIIIVLIWAILLIDYYYFVNYISDLLKYLFYALFLFLFMFTIHFFSNTVHFHLKLLPSLKNSLLMTLKNPIISLIVTFINIIIILISFKLAPFLIPFFMGFLITCISFIAFHKVSLRLHMP